MSAVGLFFIMAGVLTAWSGFNRVLVTDVVRSLFGTQTPTSSAAPGR